MPQYDITSLLDEIHKAEDKGRRIKLNPIVKIRKNEDYRLFFPLALDYIWFDELPKDYNEYY